MCKPWSSHFSRAVFICTSSWDADLFQIEIVERLFCSRTEDMTGLAEAS